MPRLKSLFSLLLLIAFATVSAQNETARSPANRGAEPTTYPANSSVEGAAAQRFISFFPDQNVGFLHVYADPNVEPNETYLMRGEEMGGVATSLLPKKFQRMARKMGAKVYASAAIRGNNENMYIVRMDGTNEDRIELFALRGNKVKHLRTLAVRKGQGRRLKQMDTYITDVDGDSYLDLITIKRGKDGSIGKTTAYVLDRDDRSFKKTTQLDLPMNSIELFDPANDNM